MLCPSATGPVGWTIPVDIGYSRPVGILSCLRHIFETEGMRALFKGLGPTLVGVAPSRALYFSVYAKAKYTLNRSGVLLPDSKFVHVGAACFAGMLCICKLYFYSLNCLGRIETWSTKWSTKAKNLLKMLIQDML